MAISESSRLGLVKASFVRDSIRMWNKLPKVVVDTSSHKTLCPGFVIVLFYSRDVFSYCTYVICHYYVTINVMVSTVAFQAVVPGSFPGWRIS